MRMDNNLKIAVYPGSLDPLTFGHIDIVGRALNMGAKKDKGSSKAYSNLYQ